MKAALIALLLSTSAVSAAELRPSPEQLREADAAVRKLPRSYSVTGFSGYYLATMWDADAPVIMGLLVSPHIHRSVEKSREDANSDLGFSPISGLAESYLVSKAENLASLGDGAPCQSEEYFTYDPKARVITADNCAGVAPKYRSAPPLPAFRKPHA